MLCEHNHTIQHQSITEKNTETRNSNRKKRLRTHTTANMSNIVSDASQMLRDERDDRLC